MLFYIASFFLLWIGADSATICSPSPTGESGELTSPNWPDAFPEDAECNWKITQDKGKWMKFYVDAIDIQESSLCSAGYINIGGVGSFCGKVPPQGPLVTGHEATINFGIYGATGKGFSLHYETSSCNDILTGTEGTISSPNYPKPYPNGVECTWKIQTSAGGRVKVEFIDFDVDYHESCGHDSVELIDMIGGNEHVSGVYCGHLTTSAVYSLSDTFIVKFKTNGWSSKKGFSLKYSTVQSLGEPKHPVYPDQLEETLREPSGLIQSPNYPKSAPIIGTRTWIIEQEIGAWIDFDFLDFDLDPKECVTIESGMDGKKQTLGTYCGTKRKPCEHLATNERAVVKYTKRAASTKRGFTLRYTTNTSCNTVLRGDSGEIYSPNYPRVYPRNMKCDWKIEVGEGKRIKVEFLDLETVYTANCESNALTLFDTVDGEEKNVGAFCGTLKPAAAYSTQNKFRVHFRAGGGVSKRGFALRYSTFN